MSILSVYHQSTPEQANKTLTHMEDIASTLAVAGIELLSLPLATALPAGADQAGILAACAEPLARLQGEGYASLEVLSLDCGIDGAPEQRTSLRQARRYPVDQQFYCVGGRLQLCLQVDDYVLAVQCEKHDLLRVPAGVVHWLDIGEQPRLALVRLFASSQVPAPALADQALVGLIPGLGD